MTRTLTTIAALAATALAFFILTSGAMADAGEVGVDADPSGNEAASLGSAEDCIEVAEGDTFDIDVYVKDVDDLIAFTIWMGYDPAIVEVADRDVQQLMTAGDSTNVLDGSAATPDSDGRYEVSAVNANDSGGGVSGSGVLARITLTAVGPGISEIDLRAEDIDGNDVNDRGPYLKDSDDNNIGDDNDDTFYDGTLRNGAIAVDASCDDADPVVAGGDDGDNIIWIIAGVVVALLVVLGLGGLVLRRRRAGGSESTN